MNWSSFKYLAHQVLHSMVKNRLMSVASIGVLTVCLLITGVAGLFTLNVGSLMLPLFVLMLAVLWYFQLQYRHVFTATATTFLAGLTLLFSFMAFTMYRR